MHLKLFFACETSGFLWNFSKNHRREKNDDNKMKTVFPRQVMQQCCFLQLFRYTTDAAHFCIDVLLTFKLAQLTCSESYSIQLHHFFPWNLWQFLVVKENSVVLFIHFVFAMNTIYLNSFFRFVTFIPLDIPP